MNTLQTIVSRIKETFYSVGTTVNGYFGTVLESFPGAWQRNMECESRENILAFSAVYTCISLISDDISKLRLKLMQQVKGVWIEVSSPAFSPVLRKPNRYQTRVQFLSQWITSKLMYGNVYVYKIRDNRSAVVELYILDPRKVTPQLTSEGDVYYYLRNDLLNKIDLDQYVPASEIIHDRMLCLFHPLVGISPIYACGTSATQGIRIQNNSGKFFENMSRPSGHLTAPGKIDDVTAARLKQHFEGNFTSGNIGRLLVTGSDMKYEPMTIPAAEAQLIEQLEWTVKDVARTFKVPMHKLGGDAPIQSSVVALNQDYYSQTLQVHIEAIEVLMDEGLGLGQQSGNAYGTELDLEGLLRMDPLSQVDFLDKAVGAGVMAPNEARAKINLPSVVGGDSPMLQQQNFSLEALSKRDAKDDPFATVPKPAAPPATPTEPAPAKSMQQTEEDVAKEIAIALISRFIGETHEG